MKKNALAFCFVYFFLLISTLSAQKKLSYNTRGELSKQDYQALLNLRKYQAISAFDTVSTKPLLVYAVYVKNKKLGILNNQAKEVTPAIYDEITGLDISTTLVMFGFHNNYPVKIGKKYGLISNTGVSILPVEYDYVRCEEKKGKAWNSERQDLIDSVIVAYKGEKELFFSPQGKRIIKKNEEAAIVKSNYSSNTSDKKSSAETTSHGNVIKKLNNGFVIVEAKVDDKYYYQGIVELATSKLVLPVVYSYLVPGQKDHVIGIKDKKYNLFNVKGELILKETYDGIENFNKIYKIRKGIKTAIFDLDLNQKTDFIFDSFGSAGPDFMEAKKDGKEGVIGAYGNTVIPFIYDKIEGYFNSSGSGFAFFKLKLNNKQGLASTKGERLTEVVYDEIFPECVINEPSFHSEPTIPTDHDYDAKNNKFFIFKKDNKFGLLNNNFKPLLANNYEYLKKSFHKDFVITGKKSEGQKYKLSLVNIVSHLPILPYDYDDIKYLGGRYFMLYKQGQMGVCDFKGKLIIPLQPHNGLSDRYYFKEIYRGLNFFDSSEHNYFVDYQGAKVNMPSN